MISLRKKSKAETKNKMLDEATHRFDYLNSQDKTVLSPATVKWLRKRRIDEAALRIEMVLCIVFFILISINMLFLFLFFGSAIVAAITVVIFEVSSGFYKKSNHPDKIDGEEAKEQKHD